MMRVFKSPPPAPRLRDGLRVYAVGDVHGRIDLLDAMLAAIADDVAARPAGRTLVLLLGDLIDRGPASAAVVARAMTPLPFATLVALRGNHEAALLAGLAGDDRMLALWVRFGGDQALASWGIDAAAHDEPDALRAVMRAAILPAAIEWLARCPLTVRIDDYLFVHAGVRPGMPLAAIAERDALWVRHPFLRSRRDHGAVVVHGHSIVEAVEIRVNRIAVDTGAYCSGRLSAIRLEGTAREVLAVAGPPATDPAVVQASALVTA